MTKEGRNRVERLTDKGSRRRWHHLNMSPKKRPDWPRCSCMSLSPSVSLSTHRSLLHHPSLPPCFPAFLPPSLSLHPLPPSPHNPYLDRSHVCCDTSWLTAHLHVCSFTSLLKGCVAVGRHTYCWMELERLRVKGYV